MSGLSSISGECMTAFRDFETELLKCLKARTAFEKSFELPSPPAFRGGNSGVMPAHGRVESSDSSSCLRAILLRSRGIDGELRLTSYLTFALGIAYENIFNSLGFSDTLGFKSQVPIEGKIHSSTSVKFSGTVDYILTDKKTGERVIVDTKGVSSLRSYHSTFIERKLKPNYVAQLLNYMECTGISRGYLVPAMFAYAPKDWLTAGNQRNLPGKIEPKITQFEIEMDYETDDVTVDGKPWDYSMTDVRRHREAAAQVIETGRVAERPVSKPGGFNPCSLCSFAQACDLYDAGFDGDLIKLAKGVFE